MLRVSGDPDWTNRAQQRLHRLVGDAEVGGERAQALGRSEGALSIPRPTSAYGRAGNSALPNRSDGGWAGVAGRGRLAAGARRALARGADPNRPRDLSLDKPTG